jgi:deoxyribodipyrimidine photo-lyase
VAPSVVWFKRDLRIDDHRPLALAAARGPVIALYVHEPALLHSPEFDPAQLRFIDECLAALDDGLRRRGIALTLRIGELPQVLDALRRATGFDTLWSHEETGNRLTFDRDLAVGRWCRSNGVAWTEIAQTGVVRRLKTRDGWARRWSQRMAEPIAEVPMRLAGPAGLDHGQRPQPGALGLAGSTRPDAQRGGEPTALATLDQFLAVRGVDYRRGMSSPVHAFERCSRLSPHLAWGSISMRRVAQAAAARALDVRLRRAAGEPIDPRWAGSLHSFQGRLRWHCHFMQKLEDEPRIEFENFARACDALRDAAPILPGSEAAARLLAWQHGETGYPMVDACMHALARCGWINFRMRAMLVSFASYHLWLHWRHTAPFLARAFLDFEPGIHYSQFQMQSGTTGINTIRIYSPAKQVLDHDPQGVFIRTELPALARVPARYLAEPHTMPASVQRESGCLIGRDYPAPVVDHATAFREARERIAAIRRRPDARTEADEIQRRHGSRRSGLPPTTTPGSRRGGPSTAAAGSRSRRSKDATAAAASGQQSLWAEVDAPACGPAGTAS